MTWEAFAYRGWWKLAVWGVLSLGGWEVWKRWGRIERWWYYRKLKNSGALEAMDERKKEVVKAREGKYKEEARKWEREKRRQELEEREKKIRQLNVLRGRLGGRSWGEGKQRLGGESINGV